VHNPTQRVAAVNPKKTIVIVEDQTLVRQGLKSLLSQNDDFEVVGEAQDGLEATRCVKKHEPDLVLLDLAMPRMNGISAIKEIKKQRPDTKIIALTFHTSDEYILAAFESGADGYCLKNDSHAELVMALTRVSSGKKYISPEISHSVLAGYLEGRHKKHTDTAWKSLTPREKQVLKLVGEGYTSTEIASYLCISPKTVDKHRANMMRKLNLHNAAALTVYAMDRGLVHPDQIKKDR
jgi:DNA-binding NarL/FixJ family response regulator